jgi:hypothetical protein
MEPKDTLLEYRTVWNGSQWGGWQTNSPGALISQSTNWVCQGTPGQFTYIVAYRYRYATSAWEIACQGMY